MNQKPRVPGVFKNVIAPVQAWLMSQGRCVGCGKDLSSGKVSKGKALERIVCQCGRVFVKDVKNQKYRRAFLNEV